MIHTGTFHRTIDDKARVVLPKRLREEIGESEMLFLTPGTNRCLELHSSQSLDQLAEKASQSAAGSKDIKSFSRLFYARAEQCDVDKSGRIRLPKSLMDYASLSREIVILGVGLNWEVWNIEQWSSYLKQNEDEFDLICQKTFDTSGFGLPQTNLKKPNELKANSIFEPDEATTNPQLPR